MAPLISIVMIFYPPLATGMMTGVLIFTVLLDGALSFGVALTLICCVREQASALILTATLVFAPAARLPKWQTLIAAFLHVSYLGIMLITVLLETISVNATLLALSGPLFLTVNV